MANNKDAGKQKNKILSIVIIVVALLVAYNIYRKQMQIVESLKQEQETEIKKNVVLGTISQSEKTLSAYKKLLNKDPSSVINTLTNIARDSGVKLTSIRPVGQRDYLLYIKYSFDLAISAVDYHKIGNFMSKVESYPDVYIVDNVSIRPIADTAGAAESESLTATLNVSIIFLKG